MQPMAPARKIVSTDRAPQAIGPYSQAVVAGDWVLTAGQIALDPATGEMVAPDDVARQTEQVLRNLRHVLEAAGSGMDAVARCDVFLLDLEDFGRMNEVYARHFAQDPPARITVQAARLPKDARVEIAAIAVR